MQFDTSWPDLEDRVRQIGEEGAAPARKPADLLLRSIGFIRNGQLSDTGLRYYFARFVGTDEAGAKAHLAEALRGNVAVSAFCEAAWPYGEIPVVGAVSLLRRLGAGPNEISAKRWLELMGRAGLVTYNRNRSTVAILHNPNALSGTVASDEVHRGHLLSPDTPYSNLLALRRVLRGARGFLYWYEAHLGDKVLEVLHGEIAASQVSRIHLLSGPAQVRAKTASDFVRFKNEFASQRRIEVVWRVLPRDEASKRHDRFIVTEGMSRNVPPLNLILVGTFGEILPSEMSAEAFEEWWPLGRDLAASIAAH